MQCMLNITVIIFYNKVQSNLTSEIPQLLYLIGIKIPNSQWKYLLTRPSRKYDQQEDFEQAAHVV